MRADRPRGVLPREGRLHQGGQEGLPDLRRPRRLPRVRADERRAVRHLGRSLRARAPQAEEARRLQTHRGARLARAPRMPRRAVARPVATGARYLNDRAAAIPSRVADRAWRRTSRLLVSHDGARWLPAVIDGLAGPAGPGRRTASPSTPAARTTSADLLARRLRRRTAWSPLPSSTGFPGAVRAGLEHLDQLGADDRVGLDPARRRQPATPRRCWPLLAGRGRRPRRRRARPQAARVALAAPAARGRRHHLRHRAPRDRPRARRVRPGPARRGPPRCSRSTPPGCWSAAACSRSSAASTTSCRSSATTSTSAGAPPRPATGPSSCRRRSSSTPRPRTAALRRTPLTGRHTHYQERRAALYTLLANARRRALPLQVVRLGVRHPAADARLPAGPRGRRRRSTSSPRCVSLVRAARGQILAARRDRRAAADRRTRDVRRRCWRRGGCPTGTASTSSATWRPPLTQSGPGRRRATPRGRRRAPTPSSSLHGRRRAASGSRTRRWSEDTGLVARFLTNPVAVAARRLRAAGARRRPLRARPRHRRRALAGARRRERLVVAAPRVLARARARAPPSPRRRTCCRWRCWPPCSAAARPRRCRRSCCWPCRSRCGAPGASCAWSAASSTPAGAPRWLLAVGRRRPTPLVPVVSGAWGDGPARHRGARGRAAALARRTPPSASPTPSPTGAGARPGAPGCCSRWSAAFAPVAWLFAAARSALVVVGLAFAIAARRRCATARSGARRSSRSAVVPVLLAPWWLPALLHGAGERLLLDGRAAARPRPSTRSTCCSAGSATSAPRGGSASCSPCWRVLALIPRGPGSPCWSAGSSPWSRPCGRRRSGVVTLDLAALSSRAGPRRSSWSCSRRRFVVAVVLGAHGLATARRAGALGPWPCSLVAVAVVAAPLGGLAWFVLDGRDRARPATATPASRRTWCRARELGPEHGILVIRGTRRGRPDLRRAPRRRRHHSARTRSSA